MLGPRKPCTLWPYYYYGHNAIIRWSVLRIFPTVLLFVMTIIIGHDVRNIVIIMATLFCSQLLRGCIIAFSALWPFSFSGRFAHSSWEAVFLAFLYYGLFPHSSWEAALWPYLHSSWEVVGSGRKDHTVTKPDSFLTMDVQIHLQSSNRMSHPRCAKHV